MNRVIKSENSAIAAHESAARQRMSIAAQVSDWGETTEDDAISDISDKLGVLLAEMGEQEDTYAQQLEEYRTVLKHIRDTEGSVQPTRDQRTKLSDEIQRLKLKEPNNHKIETMEQELVRLEAQNMVAEAQLTNVVGNIRFRLCSLLIWIVRPGKGSKKHTVSIWLRLLSAERSRDCLPATRVGCSIVSMTRP